MAKSSFGFIRWGFMGAACLFMLLFFGRGFLSVPSVTSDLSEISSGDEFHTAGDLQELLIRLLDTKSVELLKSLLQQNGVDSAGILRVGTMTAYRPDDIKLVTVIRDAERILSNGKSLAIVCAIVEANKRENVPNSPDLPIIYVFDDNGRIVKSIGSRDYMSKESAKNIDVITLGTKNSWFVLVERWDFTTSGNYRYSDFYLLADPIEKVLEVRHLYDSIGYTGTEKQAAYSGSFVSFGRTESHKFPIVADGSTPRPRIQWLADECKFKGPSKMTFKGEFLYEVNSKESVRFLKTD